MIRKKILVLGATGGTGWEVVSQALQQGHEVTAFARRPERLAGSSERLRLVAGDVTTDTGAVAEAVKGQDVVISALGAGMSFRSGGLMAQASPGLCKRWSARRSLA